jgi:26S proteasome regulatory subunit N2
MDHQSDADMFCIGMQLIRGLAMGLALIMYGREEGAETLIEQMTRDQDPILR